MNKKVILATAIVLVSVFSMFLMFSEDNDGLADTNYIGLVKLGLAPSAQPRMPTQNDINTGLILTDGENNYLLFESRDFSKLDYGKTFVVGVN